MKKIVLILSILGISGCAAVKPSDWQNLEYGAKPIEYKSIIETYMAGKLKDPYSAVYEYKGGPVKFFRKVSIAGQQAHGWGVCVTINSKNSYGGYTGTKGYTFMIINDKVVDQKGLQDDFIERSVVKAGCKRIAEIEASQPVDKQ